MTIGSLCSGIGGLEIAAEALGFGPVLWHAEIDKHASAILARHWPGVVNLGDLKATEWERVPRVDVVTAGYPCQPFSTAGKRLGNDDPRHIWPHIRCALRVLRPRLCLLENVAAHLSLGFDRVLADLAADGLDAEWTTVPASAVGAPHRRDRLFVAAYPEGRSEHDQPEVNPSRFQVRAGADGYLHRESEPAGRLAGVLEEHRESAAAYPSGSGVRSQPNGQSDRPLSRAS